MANKNTVHYQALKEKWVKRHRKGQQTLWQRHSNALSKAAKNIKHATAGTLGGLMLLASPSAQQALPSLPSIVAIEKPLDTIDKSVFLVADLAKLLPKEIRPLGFEEKQVIAQVLSRDFGIKVTAEIDGKRLNRTYGFIGAEQHLARFPGDTLYTHFGTTDEANSFASLGMAPGLGAWGYFAPSRESLTPKDIEREKYYIAVQTFLAPNFSQMIGIYRDFFKYRKMLVVNPNNGKAIVTIIGDAGPAEWTGKQLGGSPEVMRYLERVDGSLKGLVLYFFIDDPDDTIPLGPIEIKNQQ